MLHQFSRYVLAFTFLLIISYPVFSQSDFRKGFVITLEQDTVAGLIDYREGNRIYTTCDFKSSENSNLTTYSPRQILGYGITGDKLFQSKGDTAFYEILLSGVVTLRKYKETFYVQKNNEPQYELKSTVKELKIDGKRYQQKMKEYMGILNMLFFDCPEIKSSMKNVVANQRSLTDITRRYNACMGAEVQEFKQGKPWSKFMVGVSAGINSSQLRFITTDPDFEYLPKEKVSSTAFIVGLTAEFVAPRFSERLSFVTSFLYSEATYNLYTQLKPTAALTERNYITVSNKQLKIPTGLRYTFPKRSFTPFVELGFSYIYHFRDTKDWKKEQEIGGIVETYDWGTPYISKSDQLGLWGGVGVIKSISEKIDAIIHFRYEQTNGIVAMKQITVHSRITNYQLSVGIRTR